MYIRLFMYMLMHIFLGRGLMAPCRLSQPSMILKRCKTTVLSHVTPQTSVLGWLFSMKCYLISFYPGFHVSRNTVEVAGARSGPGKQQGD